MLGLLARESCRGENPNQAKIGTTIRLQTVCGKTLYSIWLRRIDLRVDAIDRNLRLRLR